MHARNTYDNLYFAVLYSIDTAAAVCSLTPFCTYVFFIYEGIVFGT